MSDEIFTKETTVFASKKEALYWKMLQDMARRKEIILHNFNPNMENSHE